MVKLFSSPDDNNLTATDYIERKRNLTLYCDYGKQNNGRKIAKTYENGQLRNASNHSNLLKLTKGYYDYHQRIDISSSLFQVYEGEKFDSKCIEENKNMNAITSNYTGIILLTDETDISQNSQNIKDTLFDNVVDYNEIETSELINEGKDAKMHKTKCFQFPLVKLTKKS
jgi:hypothetical protein